MNLKEALEILNKEGFELITQPYTAATKNKIHLLEHTATIGLRSIRFYSGYDRDEDINKYNSTFPVVNWCISLTLEKAINICKNHTMISEYKISKLLREEGFNVVTELLYSKSPCTNRIIARKSEHIIIFYLDNVSFSLFYCSKDKESEDLKKVMSLVTHTYEKVKV